MPFDIYGNNLRYGYCEVHPYVHEEYPCSMCYMENERNSRQAQPNPDPYLDALVDCCKAEKLPCPTCGTPGVIHHVPGLKEFGHKIKCPNTLRAVLIRAFPFELGVEKRFYIEDKTYDHVRVIVSKVSKIIGTPLSARFQGQYVFVRGNTKEGMGKTRSVGKY